MEEIKILIPDGFTLEQIEGGYKLVEVKKVEGEKTWEEFGKVEGYYIEDDGNNTEYQHYASHSRNRNTFPSEKEAIAYGLALPQLLQWRDKVNGSWSPDWTNNLIPKFTIWKSVDKIKIDFFYGTFYILSFETLEIAKQFYKDHKSLIHQFLIID